MEKEIQNHKFWCAKNCNTFNPTAYRKARIDQKLTKEIVQHKKSLCHN